MNLFGLTSVCNFIVAYRIDLEVPDPSKSLLPSKWSGKGDKTPTEIQSCENPQGVNNLILSGAIFTPQNKRGPITIKQGSGTSKGTKGKRERIKKDNKTGLNHAGHWSL